MLMHKKPFNPLLGETYELVTNKFRLIAEQVSHWPPITAFHVEGQNFEFSASCESKLGFNGKCVRVSPQERAMIKLRLKNGKEEIYSVNSPFVEVYNLIFGKPLIQQRGI